MRTVLGVAAAAVAARSLVLAVLVSASSNSSVLEYRQFLAIGETQSRSQRLREIQRDPWERLAPFDGQYYLDIAQRGYRRTEQWPHGNFAFLPLYPTLLRLLGGRNTGAIPYAALLQVLMTAGSSVGLWLLAERVGAPPWGAVGLMLAWPAGPFQVLIYTESLFLLLTILTALLHMRGWERAAAVAGFLAGMTRTQGLLVSFLLLPSRDPRLGSRADAGGARFLWLAPIAGFLTYLLLVKLTVGSALAALEIQAAWGRRASVGGLATALLRVATLQGLPADLLATVLGLLLLPSVFRRLPAPLALYGAGSVLLPLATGTPLSMCRFLSVAFPLFLTLACTFGDRPRTLGVLVLAGATSQAWFARALSAWHFSG